MHNLPIDGCGECEIGLNAYDRADFSCFWLAFSEESVGGATLACWRYIQLKNGGLELALALRNNSCSYRRNIHETSLSVRGLFRTFNWVCKSDAWMQGLGLKKCGEALAIEAAACWLYSVKGRALSPYWTRWNSFHVCAVNLLRQPQARCMRHFLI